MSTVPPHGPLLMLMPSTIELFALSRWRNANKPEEALGPDGPVGAMLASGAGSSSDAFFCVASMISPSFMIVPRPSRAKPFAPPVARAVPTPPGSMT